MIHEPTQSLNLESDKGFIKKNKDILTKKIRWDRYLKATYYLLYSLFVALLVSSMIFSRADITNRNILSIELISVFIGLFAVLFSIALISWIYKGTMKKLFVYNYYITHFINAFMLLVIVVVLSLPVFAYNINSTSSSINPDILEKRSLVFGLGIVIWSVIGTIGLLINTFRLKGTFPTVWVKVKLSLIAILIFPIIAMISWAAANPQSNIKSILLWIELLIVIVGILYIAFAYSYVKSFKELLLSDKTEQELQKIDIFRNISFLMVLTSSITLVALGIFKALPIWSEWSGGNVKVASLISMIIDFILLFTYLLVIVLEKNKKDKLKSTRLSTIDHSILMDAITWILLVKTIVLVAIPVKGTNIQAFMSLSSCFIAIFIINISTILLGVNFPNIKNTVPTIINILSALAVIGMVLFQSTFSPKAGSNIFDSWEMVVLLMLPVTIASTLKLGVKVISYSKIDKIEIEKLNDINENNVKKGK